VSNSEKPTVTQKSTKGTSRLRFEHPKAFVDTGMADLSRAELAVWLIIKASFARMRPKMSLSPQD